MGESDSRGPSADGSAPPLLRVASPERSPRVNYDDDDDDGRASANARRNFSKGPVQVSYNHPDALRISQAAQALASRLIGTTTSVEALQVCGVEDQRVRRIV